MFRNPFTINGTLRACFSSAEPELSSPVSPQAAEGRLSSDPNTSEQVCSTPEILAKEIDHLYKVLQDNHSHHISFNKPNPNRKPKPSTGKFIEGTSILILYIKVLCEQYRCTIAKYKGRVFFKGTNTIKSLLMHPKDPVRDT